MAIHKQRIETVGVHYPLPGTPLSFLVQGVRPTCWYDSNGPDYVVMAVFTGHDAPEGWWFVGTATDGVFVFHLFAKAVG